MPTCEPRKLTVISRYGDEVTADFLPDVSPAGDLARVGAMLDLLFFVVDWSPMGELGVDRVRELYADAKMALARLEAREEHIT